MQSERKDERPDEHMSEQKGRSEAPPGAATASRSNLPHQSARMMDAQGHFQKVVKQELQVLLASGMDRDVAVKWLLHRIVESTQEPEPGDVKRVMKQFQMNHDDAVRALIVKQEIARLKRKGLDSFAAIEELTRKMQRVGTTAENEAKLPAKDAVSAASSTVVQKEEAMEQDGKEGPLERAEEKEVDMQSAPCEEEEDSIARDIEKQASTEEMRPDEAATERATPTADAKESTPIVSVATEEEDSSAAAHADSKNVYLSSLSLCQRIGNVSISTTPAQASAVASSTDAAPHDAEATANAANPPRACPSPASSAVNSAAADPAPRSRKRRGTFHADNGSSANSDSKREATASDEHAQPTGSQQRTPRPSSPMQQSSFSSNKKQKLHVDVGESYLSMVSRKFSKEASNAPGATSAGFSTPPASIDSESESLPSEASPSLRILSHHKRRRAAVMDDQSPILEDLSGSDHIIHHTKRHKS